MVLSNVIVDITISRRSFVFNQSRARVSAGFTNVSSLAVAAFFHRLKLVPRCDFSARTSVEYAYFTSNVGALVFCLFYSILNFIFFCFSHYHKQCRQTAIYLTILVKFDETW